MAVEFFEFESISQSADWRYRSLHNLRSTGVLQLTRCYNETRINSVTTSIFTLHQKTTYIKQARSSRLDLQTTLDRRCLLPNAHVSTSSNSNVSHVALHRGRLALNSCSCPLVASTSEMHDILVAMQRNNSGGRRETTHEAAKSLHM